MLKLKEETKNLIKTQEDKLTVNLIYFGIFVTLFGRFFVDILTNKINTSLGVCVCILLFCVTIMFHYFQKINKKKLKRLNKLYYGLWIDTHSQNKAVEYELNEIKKIRIWNL